MNNKPNGFCNTCPRKLSKSPNEPCPMAMERIEALKALQSNGDKKKDLDDLPGCPWYSISAEYNYCFWRQIMSQDGKIDALEDKEICDSLGLTQAQLDKTFQSGINKFKAKRHTPEFQEMKDHLAHIGSREIDNSVYLPDSYVQSFDKILPEPFDESKPPPKLKKVQLYGIYSDKKLQKIKDEKAKNNKA